ncbi:MAG: DUF1552 domain-containing protein [Lentisphaeraceae bacterium]|nr:DUF1552 domain-containing protein [Lentisphaeraceae bacterium]
MRKRLNRRTLIKAAGVVLALPKLEAMGKEKRPINRFVAMQMPFGFLSSKLYPQTTGKDYEETDYLKILKNHRQDFTLFKGLYNPGVNGGHDANYYFLNCHSPKRSQRSQSIDSFIADKLLGQTRVSSVISGAGLRSGCSYNRIGVKIPVQSSPAAIYERLFLKASKTDVEKQRRRLSVGKSILDTTLEASKSLQRKVSRADKEKLEQYFSSIRDVEVELNNQLYWLDQDLPKHEKMKLEKSIDLVSNFSLFTKLFRLLIQTDTTRVMSYDFGQTRHVQKLPGVTGGYHNISHHRGNKDSLKQLSIIESKMISIFNEFINDLKDFQEDGTCLLDKTDIVFGSALSNPNNHSAAFPPIFLAGGSYKHAGYVERSKDVRLPLANLYLTILQRHGFEVESFVNSTGRLTTLS